MPLRPTQGLMAGSWTRRSTHANLSSMADGRSGESTGLTVGGVQGVQDLAIVLVEATVRQPRQEIGAARRGPP